MSNRKSTGELEAVSLSPADPPKDVSMMDVTEIFFIYMHDQKFSGDTPTHIAADYKLLDGTVRMYEWLPLKVALGVSRRQKTKSQTVEWFINHNEKKRVCDCFLM